MKTNKTEKPTHTPGPWRIGDAGVTVFGPKTEAPSPKTVAYMADGNSAWKANARLIAAAPDLLAALMGAEERMRNVGVTDGSALMIQVRAAIAKAEGR